MLLYDLELDLVDLNLCVNAAAFTVWRLSNTRMFFKSEKNKWRENAMICAMSMLLHLRCGGCGMPAVTWNRDWSCTSRTNWHSSDQIFFYGLIDEGCLRQGFSICASLINESGNNMGVPLDIRTSQSMYLASLQEIIKSLK